MAIIMMAITILRQVMTIVMTVTIAIMTAATIVIGLTKSNGTVVYKGMC